MRGSAATLELSAHAIVALLCVVAGWMLWIGNSAGRWCAAVALVGDAAAIVHSLNASALPHDVQPGLVTPLVIVVVINVGVWITYLYTSKRLRIWLN